MSGISSRQVPPDKSAVREFWDAHPCGAGTSDLPRGRRDYFDAVERHRYELNPEMVEMADFPSAQGTDLLEIGCGMGTDLVQFARAGASVTGVDLTPQSVAITRERLNLYGLRGEVRVADAERLPFGDESFDRVYSFGVLHHTPNIESPIREVHRVLRPGGRALVMLYHRNSVQYWIGTLIFRRAGFALLRKGFPPRALARLGGYRPEVLEGYARHLAGRPPLSRPELIALSTDGTGNPLSNVFSRTEAMGLFREFSRVSIQIRYLTRNCIPLLASRIPDPLYYWLGRRWGADLYIDATK